MPSTSARASAAPDRSAVARPVQRDNGARTGLHQHVPRHNRRAVDVRPERRKCAAGSYRSGQANRSRAVALSSTAFSARSTPCAAVGRSQCDRPRSSSSSIRLSWSKRARLVANATAASWPPAPRGRPLAASFCPAAASRTVLDFEVPALVRTRQGTCKPPGEPQQPGGCDGVQTRRQIGVLPDAVRNAVPILPCARFSRVATSAWTAAAPDRSRSRSVRTGPRGRMATCAAAVVQGNSI